jgi:hypothetical protein
MSQLMNRLARFGVIVALLVCSTGTQAATIDKKRASDLKAAFLAQLTGYTDWPKSADSAESTATPITIGVLGRDPNSVIGLIRKGIAAPGGLSAQGRRLQLMDLNTSAGVLDLSEQLQECEVLFLSEDAFVHCMVEAQPILTVGESDGFAERGGVVEFYPDPNVDRLVMRINLQALRLSGVVLSAKILSLSNVVILDADAEDL